MIGFAMCGSFCTQGKAIEELLILKNEYPDILPIMSETAFSTDTRFGRAADIAAKMTEICGRAVIHTISAAEPLGPKLRLDALVVAPCTGNTLSKAANGVTDSAVTMALKAHLRSDRPVVIALATNDALSANLCNVGIMLQKKNVYFVPMQQDDPNDKPHSLVADFTLLPDTLRYALDGKQVPKLFR